MVLLSYNEHEDIIWIKLGKIKNYKKDIEKDNQKCLDKRDETVYNNRYDCIVYSKKTIT